MTRRNRPMLLAVLLTAAAVGAAIGRPIYRKHAFEDGYRKIGRGAPESAVIGLMGKPERVDTKVDTAFWDGVTLDEDVARQVARRYGYTTRLTLVPISWTLDFDAAGRVVSKHRWD